MYCQQLSILTHTTKTIVCVERKQKRLYKDKVNIYIYKNKYYTMSKKQQIKNRDVDIVQSIITRQAQ
jgi:hypothetical protein